MAARRHREVPLTSLNHHLDLNWMHEAYWRVNKNAAPGVDGQTWADYGENLTDNLKDLLSRAKSGSYQAPPVKRAYVPKNDKEKRPIGLPTIENKVLERAVSMVLEPVYEEEFYDFSFGFRPGRNAQQALSHLRGQCLEQKVQWVLEVDLRQFFDTVDHGKLRELLSRRVQDGVIAGLIGKWLKAGVWEEGRVSHPDAGTPQGGVISPLLSNIYLHEVLDKWFVESLRPHCAGRTFLVRYADDFVMGFERLEDARKAQRVIVKRFAKYGLSINQEKSRLVRFKRPSGYDKDLDVEPGSFDFLGFTLYWGTSRNGTPIPKAKTSGKRFARALRKIKEWGWRNRHLRLREQWQQLNAKLRGHDAYYGVTHNVAMLQRLREEVKTQWRRWLNRRNRRGGYNWKQFNELLRELPLTPARVVHSVM